MRWLLILTCTFFAAGGPGAGSGAAGSISYATADNYAIDDKISGNNGEEGVWYVGRDTTFGRRLHAWSKYPIPDGEKFLWRMRPLSCNTTPFTVSVRVLAEDFDELTSNWWYASTGVLWSEPGGMADPDSPVAFAELSYVDNITIDVTELVEYAVDRGDTEIKFIMAPVDDAPVSACSIQSRESNFAPVYRPRLVGVNK